MRVDRVVSVLAFVFLASACGREALPGGTESGGAPINPARPDLGDAGAGAGPGATPTPPADHTDTGFGTMGRVSIDFGSADGRARRAAIDPSGNVVLAGRFEKSGTHDTAVARYTAMGAADATLGGDGWINADLANGNRDWGSAIAILPDGTMYVSGSLVVTTYTDLGKGVILASDTQYATIAHFLADGSLDDAFASHGVLKLSQFTGDAVAIVPGANGTLWVGLDANHNSGHVWSVAHVEPNGTLDAGWGSNGHADVQVSSSAHLADIALDANGRIYLAGSTSSAVRVARLDATGALDAGFGNGGIADDPFAENTSVDVSTMSLDPAGRILVCGTLSRDASGNTVRDAIVERLSTNGAPDTGFGMAGRARLDFGADDEAGGRAVGLADGHVMVGMSSNGLGVARLLSNGALDPSWSPNGGWNVSQSADPDDVAEDMVSLPGGQWIVAGTNRASPDTFVLAAFTP